MKVKLIDFFLDDHNYGCKLIQFAMTKYLQDNYNAIVEIYDTRPIENWNIGSFNQFDDKFLNTKAIRNITDIYNDDADTDFYMLCGDQVWNFSCRNNLFFHEFFTLPKIISYKKIAYSVSDNNWLNYRLDFRDSYVKHIGQFANVSVRENTTAICLRDHFQRLNINNNVHRHIDPVFLINQDFWKTFAVKPSFIQEGEKFDFYYYVHTTNIKNTDINNINKYYSFGNVGKPKDIDYDFSVQEWLWMILNCQNFYSNSFHGLCFSIIFNKKINNNYLNNDMRKKNLLEILSISDINNVNFQTVANIIKNEQDKTKKYFNNIFTNHIKKICCVDKDSFSHLLSTSGGITGKIAKTFFDSFDESLVYGAAYTQDFKKVITIGVSNIIDYYRFLAKSKYNFCFMPKLKTIKEYLDTDKHILYIGCPCQIMALRRFLNKDYANLYTVELICHGYSKPRYLEEFVNIVETENRSKIIGLDMRVQHQCTIKVTFENGQSKKYNSIFSRFINKVNMIEKCKTCKFHNGSRQSDITVGDFWEYKPEKFDKVFDPKTGSNIVYLNTVKGINIFNKLKNDIIYYEFLT